MDIIKLSTRTRNGTGKSYTRKTRVQGWVPAIFYGHGREALKIEVDAKEFASIVRNRKMTHLIDLGLGDNKEESLAVIREVQRHVLKENTFFHIDFQRVAMDEKVTIECPVEMTGVAIGVKEGGGVLGNPVKKVMIECMPSNIPDKIVLDVSALNVGDSIHVRDVVIPNVTLKEAPEEVLVVVTHPMRESVEEGKPEAAAAGAGASPAAGA